MGIRTPKRRGGSLALIGVLIATVLTVVAAPAHADPSVLAVTPSTLALPDLPASSNGEYFVRLTLDPGYSFNLAASGSTGHPEGDIAQIEPHGAGTLRDCADTAPGQSCLVAIDWVGSDIGWSSTTLTYVECAAGGVDCRSVDQPFTVGPQFARMPTTLPDTIALGQIPVGTSITHDVTVLLDDGYFVSQAVFFNDPAFHFDFGTCGLHSVGSCTSHVTFSPTAVGSYIQHLGYQECAGSLDTSMSCIADYATPMVITASAGQAPTSISLTRLRAGGGIETATLTAALTHMPLSHRTVTFTIGSRTVCTAVTNSAGAAQCRFRAADAAQAVLVGQYQARFAGDTNYEPTTGRAGLLY